MAPNGEKGVIRPLPESAVPLIKWRLRYIGEPHSKVVMEDLPTCANCHSFSRDGKTLGLDVDGPVNDKGLYGLVPVSRNTYRKEDVLRWSSFAEKGSPKRFGFMSQMSPDGQYVVTSIENPGSHEKRIRRPACTTASTRDYGFGQVFFPTRGMLAWYSRATGKLQPLPGADDPRLRADERLLESRRQVPGLFAGGGARSLSRPEQPARHTPTIPTRRRSSTTSIAFPSTAARAARRNAIVGASRKRHEQQLSQGLAGREVDRVRRSATTAC